MDDTNNGTQPAPSTETEQQKCTVCSKTTSGYKCAECGQESATHDEAHPCGGTMCQPKCVGCSQAESKCTCQPAATPGQTTPPMGGTPGM